jgi:hypothetical protein
MSDRESFAIVPVSRAHSFCFQSNCTSWILFVVMQIGKVFHISSLINCILHLFQKNVGWLK